MTFPQAPTPDLDMNALRKACHRHLPLGIILSALVLGVIVMATTLHLRTLDGPAITIIQQG